MNTPTPRQICLDTETTGLDAKKNRIIEIGAVEISNRQLTRHEFQCYCNPEVDSIDAEAVKVHGLTVEFLRDKPLFKDICQDFLDFIDGAELIIHNAPFDLGFLDAELKRTKLIKVNQVKQICPRITDSLQLARALYPGKRNSLDELKLRCGIGDERILHGALLDAQILAKVYLAMTGGQEKLGLDSGSRRLTQQQRDFSGIQVPVIKARADELAAHQWLVDKMNQGQPITEQDFKVCAE